MTADGVKRIDLIFPGTTGVVSVPEDQLDTFLAQGWQKPSRGSRRADTGTVPVQRNVQ